MDSCSHGPNRLSILDDILVHAPDEPIFIDRVTTIFQRFRQYNITINPKKCFLGLSEVEYVGHKISPSGITFTKERLYGISKIPKPEF